MVTSVPPVPPVPSIPPGSAGLPAPPGSPGPTAWLLFSPERATAKVSLLMKEFKLAISNLDPLGIALCKTPSPAEVEEARRYMLILKKLGFMLALAKAKEDKDDRPPNGI